MSNKLKTKNTSEHNTDTLNQINTTTLSATHISSPFPLPEILNQYMEINTDIGERILKYTEENAEHRKNMDREQITNQKLIIENSHKENTLEIKHRSRGQNFAFGSILVLAGSSLFAAFNDFTTLSCILGGTTLIGIVGAFLGRNKSNNSNVQ